MIMLIGHVTLWAVAAALSIFFAVVAFKHKWYFVCGIDGGIALLSMVAIVGIITNYFAN